MGGSQSHPGEEIPVGRQVMDVYEHDIPPDDGKRGKKRKSQKKDEVGHKKIAKLNTRDYVYQTLFLEGVDSDVTISACGRAWNVHKIYLKQAKFFESMFDGEWAEAKSRHVQMTITDPNINSDGLNAVLGSLYNNEIELDLDKIEGTIATSSYLLLDSVTERCSEMIIEALSIDNAVRFLGLSLKYGLTEVTGKSMGILLHNFWKIMTDREKLRDIEHELLVNLLNSPNLFICEGEYDIYKAIKAWIYMQEVPDCRIDETLEVFHSNVSKFLQESEPDFLLKKYLDVISSIRLDKTLSSTETIKTMKKDGLIPEKVIDEMTSALWMTFLESEENPKALDISEEDFFSECYRLGRALDTIPKCWRWVGFNNGVDLLLHLNSYSICIKRNCLNQKAPYSVNLKSKHLLHYRLVVCDSNGKVMNDSGKMTWEMGPDESKVIFRLKEDTQPPLSVHFQYLIHKPINKTSHYLNKYLNEKEAVEEKNNEDEEE